MIIVLFLLMFALMFLGMEIFVSMGVASAVYLLITGNAPLNLISTNFVNGISSYSLLAIPFFMLVGELMNASGMTKKVINLTQFFIGSFKGGLAYAAIFVNMLIACISGSAPADCSAVSSVLIPEMEKEGYPDNFAAAVNCCASVLGPIIPPSIPMVFLAMLCNLSTGKLLIGGLLPGLLLTGALIFVSWFLMRKMELHVTHKEKHFSDFWKLFKDAALALVAPVIIVTGVFSGFVTVTEVAMLASAYVLLVGVLVYHTLTIPVLIDAFKKATAFASSLMALFGVVGIFSWFIAVEEIPDKLFALIAQMNLSPVLFLLGVNILLLLVGMIMDAVPAMTIFMPVLMPIAVEMGIDPIHFGVMVVVNLMMGLITPPVGALLYVECKISGISFIRLAKAVVPFIAAFLICLLVVTYVPQLSTVLPQLLMG